MVLVNFIIGVHHLITVFIILDHSLVRVNPYLAVEQELPECIKVSMQVNQVGQPTLLIRSNALW